MSKFIYLGPFKNHIQNFIELKKAVGYKYITVEGRLKRFDNFTLEKYPKTKILTKEIVLNWCSKKTYEAQANQSTRTTTIREFGKYLDSIGIKAYVIPKGYYPAPKQYTPYIYTSDELARFFAQTDRCHYSCEFPKRHLIMPVIFRMIYMCGLRVSEARLLKVGDVDLVSGVLSIQHAKKDNSRLVPMSDCLAKRCRIFSAKAHPHPVAENYYFPALNNLPMTLGNIYKNFRKFLWKARISHGGFGYGPRIHDFRHCYAVHCLKKWVEQEKDLTVYLPVLKTYMGHDSFEDTAYYLHLTADVFPNIIIKIETRYPGIIPTTEGDSHEAD
ncbi:MAG: tyrosine-type recombinase/integrase [Coxiellaceae bacterium]|nr:tyrosine-type recombinase/integrase [Coxiellaceae bacterium]